MNHNNGTEHSVMKIQCPKCHANLNVSEIPITFGCPFCDYRISISINQNATTSSEKTAQPEQQKNVISIPPGLRNVKNDTIKNNQDSKKIAENQDNMTARIVLYSIASFALLITALIGPWIKLGSIRSGSMKIALEVCYGTDSSMPTLYLVLMILVVIMWPLPEFFSKQKTYVPLWAFRLLLSMSIAVLWVVYFFKTGNKVGRGVEPGWGFFISGAIIVAMTYHQLKSLSGSK